MKELTKEEVLDKNVSIDCNDLQYYGSGIYQAMQEYSDQNIKPLIDEIEQQKMQCSVYHNDILNLEDEIDKLKSDLKAAESVNEWISVEDRLPTERVEAVLLFNANAPKYNQCVYAGTWFLQENKFTSDSKFNLMGTVTHWMPLPTNPI